MMRWQHYTQYLHCYLWGLEDPYSQAALWFLWSLEDPAGHLLLAHPTELTGAMQVSHQFSINVTLPKLSLVFAHYKRYISFKLCYIFMLVNQNSWVWICSVVGALPVNHESGSGLRNLYPKGVYFFSFALFILLGYSWLTMLWQFQMNSKGTQPHIYTSPFSLNPLKRGSF